MLYGAPVPNHRPFTAAQYRTLGRAVRQRRADLKLTQEDAAREAGVSLSIWRSVETGARRNHRWSTMRSVASALGWDPDSLTTIAVGGDPELAPERADGIEDRLERIEALLEDVLAAVRPRRKPRS